MIGPTVLVVLAISGGATATVGLLTAGIALNTKDFANRAIWTDDATRRGKLRVLALHSYHETDWRAVGRLVPKLLLGSTATVTALVLFCVGVVEVFG